MGTEIGLVSLASPKHVHEIGGRKLKDTAHNDYTASHP